MDTTVARPRLGDDVADVDDVDEQSAEQALLPRGSSGLGQRPATRSQAFSARIRRPACTAPRLQARIVPRCSRSAVSRSGLVETKLPDVCTTIFCRPMCELRAPGHPGPGGRAHSSAPPRSPTQIEVPTSKRVLESAAAPGRSSGLWPTILDAWQRRSGSIRPLSSSPRHENWVPHWTTWPSRRRRSSLQLRRSRLRRRRAPHVKRVTFQSPSGCWPKRPGFCAPAALWPSATGTTPPSPWRLVSPILCRAASRRSRQRFINDLWLVPRLPDAAAVSRVRASRFEQPRLPPGPPGLTTC